jgi:sulfite exporter TauE/SafE
MLLTVVLAGLLAGFVHVLSGPDHLAAIAPYAVQGKARAWKTGVRWGLGHSAGVLVVGLLAMLARHVVPIDLMSAWAERGVGVVLIAIGIWALRKALRLGSGPITTHAHGREAFAVGTVHGLAGSSHLLGVLPALALPTDAAAAAYLVLFGIGTVSAMAVFSSAVGWISNHRRASAPRAQGALLATCAVCAMAVGAFWLLSDLSA